MLLEIPGRPEDLFGNHFSDMNRLDSMLRDYKIVIKGKAWKFGSQYNAKNLLFVVEERNFDQRGVHELENFFRQEEYMVDDEDDGIRSFNKKQGTCTFRVDCIITDENALATIFDSGEAPHSFKKARFWHGIYGVYRGDFWSSDSKDFVYGACAMTKASMKALQSEFSSQVAANIGKDLAEESEDEGTANSGSC